MVDTVRDFYDQLAPTYHLIFPDWAHAVQRHGALLSALIRTHLGSGPHAVLDCSCGIGTQALGLAAQGYRVTATDLSPRAVAQARDQATALG